MSSRSAASRGCARHVAGPPQIGPTLRRKDGAELAVVLSPPPLEQAPSRHSSTPVQAAASERPGRATALEFSLGRVRSIPALSWPQAASMSSPRVRLTIAAPFCRAQVWKLRISILPRLIARAGERIERDQISLGGVFALNLRVNPAHQLAQPRACSAGRYPFIMVYSKVSKYAACEAHNARRHPELGNRVFLFNGTSACADHQTARAATRHERHCFESLSIIGTRPAVDRVRACWRGQSHCHRASGSLRARRFRNSAAARHAHHHPLVSLRDGAARCPDAWRYPDLPMIRRCSGAVETLGASRADVR